MLSVDTVRSTKKHPPGWRAVLIGALLIIPGFYFGTYSYLIVQALPWSQISLPLGGVMVLFFLVLFNQVVGGISRRLRLEQSELLVIYAMTNLCATIGGAGMLAFLITTLPAGHYFATPENKWATFFEHIPSWLVVNDATAITNFYEAQGTLYSLATLQAWAVPLAFWLSFTGLLVLGTLALCNLVADQWVNRERLSFPLVQLPLAMTARTERRRFWGNRLMWIGFAIPAVLQSFNFINYLHPSFPGIWVKAIPLGQGITAMPLAAIKPVYVAFYPFMIGVGFLLSAETSLSCWFFYWVGKAEQVLCAVVGMGGTGTGRGVTQLPLITQQGTGALLTLMVVALMVAWPNLRASLRTNRPAGVQVVSSRISLIILALVFVSLVTMSSAAGLPIAIGAVYFILRWLMALAWGRVAAETGSGWTRQWRSNIQEVVANSIGTASLAPQALPMLAMFRWFNSYADSRAPQIMAAFKMSQAGEIPRYQLRRALVTTVVVSLIGCTWALLHIYYSYGAAMATTRQWYTGEGGTSWWILQSWFNFPQGPNWWDIGGYIFGGMVVLIVTAARRSIPGWPLHPVGYAIGHTCSMDYMWMPFLVAWALKSLALRYGGIKVYHYLVPLFIGLILGDFVTAGLWGLYGTIVGQRMYMFFPH